MRGFFDCYILCCRRCRFLGGIIGRQAKAMPGQTACGIGHKVTGGAGEHGRTLLEECNLVSSFIFWEMINPGSFPSYATFRYVRRPMCQVQNAFRARLKDCCFMLPATLLVWCSHWCHNYPVRNGALLIDPFSSIEQ